MQHLGVGIEQERLTQPVHRLAVLALAVECFGLIVKSQRALLVAGRSDGNSGLARLLLGSGRLVGLVRGGHARGLGVGGLQQRTQRYNDPERYHPPHEDHHSKAAASKRYASRRSLQWHAGGRRRPLGVTAFGVLPAHE